MLKIALTFYFLFSFSNKIYEKDVEWSKGCSSFTVYNMHYKINPLGWAYW